MPFSFFRVRWEESEVVQLTEDLTIHATGLPTSGLVTAALIKIMQKIMEPYSEEDKSREHGLHIYQYFVESMKHCFAMRTLLGDIVNNDMKQFTLMVSEYIIRLFRERFENYIITEFFRIFLSEFRQKAELFPATHKKG